MPISLNKLLNTFLDRTFKNKMNENFEMLEDSHNKIEQDSKQAVDSAKAANTLSNSVKKQLDTIVITGDSSVEAAQARVDSEGKAHYTLKERLDKDFQKNATQIEILSANVTAQLADNAYLVPKPDGVNDKQIIRDALIYAGQNGLNVKFPPKYTYKVSANATKENVISIPYSNMTIDLNGSKIELQPNGFPHYHVIDVPQKDNIVIKNGIIQGDRKLHNYSDQSYPTHEFGYGVSIDRSTVTLENLEIYDMIGDSVYNLDYIDNGDGTWSDGTGVVKLINCNLHHSRRQGFSVLCSNEIYLDKCHIHSIGDSDGILGAAPQGGIDLEPNSRTKRILKFIMRNTVIDCPMSSIIATGDCPNFKVIDCELNGRIMIETGIKGKFVNTDLNFEYVNSSLTVGYSTPQVEFENCRFRVNRFNMRGKYNNCRVTGMTAPILSNLVRIYKNDTKLMNTTFENLRSTDFKALLFDSVQAEENKFNFTNVTIENCDISLSNADLGTSNNYKPIITGVKFLNSYLHLLRDIQEFRDCRFENMTWRDTPSYFTQSLFKMVRCEYIAKTSTDIVNLIRKDIYGSQIELNGFGSTIFGMTGQPTYISNSYIKLEQTPAVINIPNGKIINSFMRINQPSTTLDFNTKLANTVVEFNV